jgi:hypothetical protein
MRSIVFLLSVVGLSLLAPACDGELICTEELRVAVRVHISSPEDLPVDRVTADLKRETECESFSLETDASGEGIYRCNEQGGGRYTIRVYSGDMSWSTGVSVTANECHTTEIKDVDVVLDPASASAEHDD